jgi:HSP20 family protein
VREDEMDKQLSYDRKVIVPACSIAEDSGLVTVKLEMPGVAKDGIELRIEGNSLTVEGKREEEALKGDYLVRERRYGTFRKAFTLDETIDREKIDAELVDGILSVKLNVKEAAKPRRIAIA